MRAPLHSLAARGDFGPARAGMGTLGPSHEIAQALVRIGHEVEEVVTLGPVDGPLAVGRVAEIEEPHRVSTSRSGPVRSTSG